MIISLIILIKKIFEEKRRSFLWWHRNMYIFFKIILFILYIQKKSISFLCSLYIFPFLTLFHVWSRIILETRDFKRSFPFVRLTNWFDVANNCSWFDRLIKKGETSRKKKFFFHSFWESRSTVCTKSLYEIAKVSTTLRSSQPGNKLQIRLIKL